MIQDYEIKNNNAIAYDNIKGSMNYEYQDNIDKIFIQKNILEQINNDLNLAHIKIEKLNKDIATNTKKMKKSEILACIFLLIAILCILPGVIFGLSSMFGSLLGLICSTVAMFKNTNYKFQINELNKKLNGSQLVEQQLNNLFSIEYQKLKTLENNKTKNITKEKKETFKLENKNKLDHIKHLRNLYYTIGIYIKELRKYYAEGTLREHLPSNVFSNQDLTIIENLITEKRTQLIKRKSI